MPSIVSKGVVKKLPMPPPENGLKAVSFALNCKSKLDWCPRCKDAFVHCSLYDPMLRMENKKPPIFYVQCGRCNLRTQGYLKPFAAIWDWNGVWQRRNYETGERRILRRKTKLPDRDSLVSHNRTPQWLRDL